ncbi:MAG: sulfite exporter TauE/SafE family protein [Alphaproteobacteria bacterium]|nr:sulfite exporter TauE/SafE family protein [Alphaproteobacteria bacterium]
MTALLVAIIVGLSYAVQSTFGFGAGLISLPFLTLLIGAKASISMNLIFQTMTGFLLFSVWKDISFKKLPLFLFTVFIGIVCGVLFLNHVSDSTLEVLLGCYLVFYAGKQMVGHRFPKHEMYTKLKASPLYAIACGFPGGLISGAFGTGGPMLVSFVKSMNLPKINMRATILLVMFYCNVFRVWMAWKTGQFDKTAITYALYALPLFIGGIFCGSIISRILTESQFKNSINMIILLAGGSLLIKHFIF